MSQKPQQHPNYRHLPQLLRQLREDAELTQRQLGARLKKPQSWIYNCETANRRIDVTEFVVWARACGVDAVEVFRKLAGKIK